jgi:uncharacterized Zn finger protein
MVAVFPANPKHCPKCSEPLMETETPENFCIVAGGVASYGYTTFYCAECGIFWHPHQIPDHPLYDPDSIWCPHCGSQDKRETDRIQYGFGTRTSYHCCGCGQMFFEYD